MVYNKENVLNPKWVRLAILCFGAASNPGEIENFSAATGKGGRRVRRNCPASMIFIFFELDLVGLGRS